MRNVYQQKKWDLFQKIESTKGKERSALLEQFNNMIGVESHNKLYGETNTSVGEDTQETENNGS